MVTLATCLLGLIGAGPSPSCSGMQATMYPNAYGSNCNSGSSQPYSLRDFGSLKEDPLLPQRCQDPTTMQVSILPGMASSGKASGVPCFAQRGVRAAPNTSWAALKHDCFAGCSKAA